MEQTFNSDVGKGGGGHNPNKKKVGGGGGRVCAPPPISRLWVNYTLDLSQTVHYLSLRDRQANKDGEEGHLYTSQVSPEPGARRKW